MKQPIWNPVTEMDLDDGTHTCYGRRIGNFCFVFLTQLNDDTWDVELRWPHAAEYTTLCNCKTLRSAKSWVTRNLLTKENET